MTKNKFKVLFYWFSIMGALAVILGAFGAHTLKKFLEPSQLEIYKTGVQYQFYHLILLGVVALLQEKKASRMLSVVFYLCLAGIFLFSGSLYLLSCRFLLGIESWTWLGPLTPIGGLCFIAAWITFAFSINKTYK